MKFCPDSGEPSKWRLRKAGATVWVVGLNEASATMVDRFKLHDKESCDAALNNASVAIVRSSRPVILACAALSNRHGCSAREPITSDHFFGAGLVGQTGMRIKTIVKRRPRLSA